MPSFQKPCNTIKRPTRPVSVAISMILINVFGRDPATGFAGRPIDNIGVQYGLKALNAHAITKQQFLELDQNIGGYDNDGNYVPTRTVGDVAAIKAAYESGRTTYGGLGMKRTHRTVLGRRSNSGRGNTTDEWYLESPSTLHWMPIEWVDRGLFL